jgi:hypothetical protein
MSYSYLRVSIEFNFTAFRAEKHTKETPKTQNIFLFLLTKKLLL